MLKHLFSSARHPPRHSRRPRNPGQRGEPPSRIPGRKLIHAATRTHSTHILFGPYKLKFVVIESTGVECRTQNQA